MSLASQPHERHNAQQRANLRLTRNELSFLSMSDPVTIGHVTRGRGAAHTRKQVAQAKHAFLESYAQWANISLACEVSGVSRSSFYRWQEHDAQFAAGFNQANEAATERLEAEAWRRAREGTPYKRTSYWHGEPVGTDEKIEYSDQLMMLLLRARRPDLYREKVDVAVQQIVKTVVGLDPASVL